MSGKGKGKAKGGGGGDEGGSGGKEKIKTANHVKVRHILCEKQGKINEAYAKIKEGKAFSSVATEYSEDKAKAGGSLGWMARGQMVEPFQTKAFSQPLNVPSEPFKTVHGYHIILVEERKA